MLLQGILGIMTGVGIATLAAIGLLVYINQQTEQQHQSQGNYRRAQPRSEWRGYEATDESIFCSICLEVTKYPNQAVLACGHAFHRVCISQWMSTKQECPNCRKHI